MAGKGKLRSKKQRIRSRNTRTHPRRSATNVQNIGVHRRLAVYPKTASASWLDKLAWYGSIALKLFTLITGVNDDLEAETKTHGAGTTMLLGPSDFAAVCPSSSLVYTSKDKEIMALRVLPYERGSLGKVTIKIVPSVDLSNRGGMYAAVVCPLDVNSTATKSSPDYADRYVPDYDQIIKNPRAVMAPSTKPITLSFYGDKTPRIFTCFWKSESNGYTNAYPTHAVMIAFSSLATEERNIDADYSPSRSLFEVHIRADLRLHEPTSIPDATEKPTDLASYVTNKIERTNDAKINMRFYNRSWDFETSTPSLFRLPYADALSIVTHYRPELVTKLITHHPESLSAMGV